MAESQQVKARIDKKTGIMKLETKNFSGDGCHVIDQIEHELGTVTHTQETDERYNYLQPDYLPNQVSG